MPLADQEQELPDNIKPFSTNGVEVKQVSHDEWLAYCPWCAKQKLYANSTTGQWTCHRCGDKGNASVFLRLLWERSPMGDYAALAQERKLLSADTPRVWGCKRHSVTGDWCLPGYNQRGVIVQLYRYVGTGRHRRLWATGGVGHGLMGVPLAGKHGVLSIAEGPWDGMALWEVQKELHPQGGVVAVPGANVFKEQWAELFVGRAVALWYDNDHERVTAKGVTVQPTGYCGMRHAAGCLLAAKDKPKAIEYTHWGRQGFNPSLPDGYDVRDALVKGGTTVKGRVQVFKTDVLPLLTPAPDEWALQTKQATDLGLSPLPCNNWRVLEQAWRKAMRWRTELADVLACMLAVVVSTDQQGDQLFLQVIGEAGSGKTRFCDGLLVSRHCYALEHLTGFHSGYKGADGGDYSLISRINGKTLITPEGDVIMSSPRVQEIMSQQRRLFDGNTSTSFKNRKEDAKYANLRTPWIMAGTPAMLDNNQGKLGDRFLRVVINPPDDDEKEAILRRVGFNALGAVCKAVNGKPETGVDENMAEAYRLTGGYVDYLRANASELISCLQVESTDLVESILPLAEFTAYMRAKPDPHKNSTSDAGKELPTRLTAQYVRLAVCLAAATGRKQVDATVYQRVRKVALDTAKGRPLDLATKMYLAGQDGCSLYNLSNWTNATEDNTKVYLRFLKRIGVVEAFELKTKDGRNRGHIRYRLTDRMRRLWDRVVEDVPF